MGGKYKGKHVAGNVDPPAADPVAEMTDDEKLEKEAKGRPRSRTSVKGAAERLKDVFAR